MARPTTHIHRITHSLVRPSLLHIALLLSCGMLIVQGAGSSSKATPLTRRERNTGCAQSCAQVSEMARCLRMACRKNAMGPLIRFGKRGRDGVSTDDNNSAGSSLTLPPQNLPLPLERGTTLKRLLSRDDISLPKDLGEDGEELQGKLAWGTFEPELLLAQPLLTSHQPGQDSPHRKGDLRLLMWLLQASRGLNMELPPDDGDKFPSLRTPDELNMPETHIVGREPSLDSDLSPITYQDLSRMLGKQTSSTSSKEDQDYSDSHPGQKMRRHQRGLLKHMIRFG